MIEFNKEYWIEQLKKEVGLMEVPLDELHKHEVELDSPTGRSSGFKVNAKEYIDKQLEFIEADYKKQTPEISFESFTPEPTEIKQIAVTPLKEVKASNIRFFIVSFDGINEFVVIINDDGEWQAQDQINQIINERFFIKEKKREDMLGLENVISFYQYHAYMITIPNPQQPLTAYEKISQNMDTVFDGLKLKGIL